MKKTGGKNMAFMGLVFLLAAEIACGQEKALIHDISGTVEVKTPGASAWTPARRGQELEKTALVSTGFKSTAVIVLGNSTLLVQPLIRLSIEELVVRAGDAGRVDVYLHAGRIRVDVKPPSGGTAQFTVRSPAATASVRRTVFEFDGIRLGLNKGRAHLRGGDRSGIYVSAGGWAVTDIVTGRTASAAETAKEGLTPALPAGIGSVLPEVKIDISPVIEAGFNWLWVFFTA
ncbi:MAG: FecR family protein [Treponema sp.]|nr:FecR family protein [Treponema sp.]